MIKFECTSCTHRKCTCELEDTLCSPPQNCINKYVSFIPNWHEVKEETTTKRSRLPDWVKECAIGYDNEQKRYFEVIDIDKKWVDIEYLDDGNGATCSYTDMQNCSEAVKRPFNEKEMQGLVGKIMEHATGRYLITACASFSTGEWKIEADDQYYLAELLLKDDFTIDGKPCYVLEHLENGEWVE